MQSFVAIHLRFMLQGKLAICGWQPRYLHHYCCCLQLCGTGFTFDAFWQFFGSHTWNENLTLD